MNVTNFNVSRKAILIISIRIQQAQKEKHPNFEILM